MTHLETGLSMHMYLLFMKVWTFFLGNSPLIVKAPSLLAGILILPALYQLTKKWLNQRVAILAILFAAFNPFLIEFSRYARVYSILLLVIILVIYLYYQAFKKRQSRYFIWLGIANGLALTFSSISSYIILVQFCSAVIETLLIPSKRDWKLFLNFCWSFILSLLLGLLFYSQILVQIPPMLAALTSDMNQWNIGVYFGVFKILHPYTAVVMLGLLLMGCLIAIKRYKETGRFLILWATVPFIFFFLTGTNQPDLAIARFLILVLPAHFILIASALLFISRKLVPQYSTLTAVFLTTALIFGNWIYSPANTLEPIITEPHGSSIALQRLNEIIQPNDVLSEDPDHLRFILNRPLKSQYIKITNLVSTQSKPYGNFTRSGRLIIVTFNHPEALQIWSKYFSTEVIVHPYYTNELVILTSPKITDRNHLNEILSGYFTGSLKGIDREPEYLKVLPGRFEQRINATRDILMKLNQYKRLQDESPVVNIVEKKENKID